MSYTSQYDWSRNFADDMAGNATEKAFAGEHETAAALAAVAQAHATMALAAATMAAAENE